MTVLICDEKFDAGVSEVDGFELVHDLNEGLKRSTFLTIHIPLTDKSANLIDKDKMLQMPKGSYLVNCARGGIVDEKALAELTGSGHIAASAFDVFSVEPIAADNPLLEADNTQLSSLMLLLSPLKVCTACPIRQHLISAIILTAAYLQAIFMIWTRSQLRQSASGMRDQDKESPLGSALPGYP